MKAQAVALLQMVSRFKLVAAAKVVTPVAAAPVAVAPAPLPYRPAASRPPAPAVAVAAAPRLARHGEWTEF